MSMAAIPVAFRHMARQFPIVALISVVLTSPVAGKVPADKERIARQVFEKLVAAIRNDSTERPKFRMEDMGPNMAGHIPLDGTVVLHERAYDICMTFPDSLDALAVLIAHELAHHYLKHRLLGVVPPKKLAALSKRFPPDWLARDEMEADMVGWFYSRLAGYNALDIAPAVLEKIYGDAGIPDSPLYLKLDERKDVAWTVEGALSGMIATFDAANYLTLIRRYRDAGRCYDRLLRAFPSRELFNNAGVVATLEALELMGGKDVGFIFPVELDADTRLRGVEIEGGAIRRITRSPDPDDSALIVRLLDEAELRFDSAMRRDSLYTPAIVNLATVRILKKEYDGTLLLAREVRRLDSTRRAEVLASTIEAIALARLGKEKDALRLLSGLTDLRELEQLVSANLAVLRGITWKSATSYGRPNVRETVYGVAAEERGVLRLPDTRDTVAGSDEMSDTIFVLSRRRVSCEVIRAERPGSWSQFVVTSGVYDGATREGVAIGSSGENVLNAYGDAPRIVTARQGSYYIYDYSKIIFLIDTDGRVKTWILYAYE